MINSATFELIYLQVFLPDKYLQFLPEDLPWNTKALTLVTKNDSRPHTHCVVNLIYRLHPNPIVQCSGLADIFNTQWMRNTLIIKLPRKVVQLIAAWQS